MKLLDRIANARNLVILFLLLLGCYLFLNAFHHPVSILSIKGMSGGHTILNLLPFYNAEIAYEYLLSYSPAAISHYFRVLVFDVLLMIPVYVLFFSAGIRFFLQRITRLNPIIIQRISLLPMAAGGLNLVENVLITSLLTALPDKHVILASISGFVTFLKTGIISISMFSVLVMFLSYAVKIGLGSLRRFRTT